MNIWKIVFSIVILAFSFEMKAQMEERQNALIKKLQVEYISCSSSENYFDTAFYDKKSRLIKRISFNDNVLVQKDEVLEYDENNNPIIQTKGGVNPNNQQFEISTLKSTYEYVDTIIVKDDYSSYDSLGNIKYTITKRYALDEGSKVVVATEKGFYGSKNDILNDSTITNYEYNAQGKITKEFKRSSKTQVGFDSVTEYQYNELGQLVEEKTLFSLESYLRTVYTYNEKGWFSRAVNYGFGDSLKGHSEYDSDKNDKERIINIYSAFYEENGLISKVVDEENGNKNVTQFKYKFYE